MSLFRFVFFYSLSPLDGVTPVLRCQSTTVSLSNFCAGVRSAACHPKECGSTGLWSIRSSAPLRLRFTMLTSALWVWYGAPPSSSWSRSISEISVANQYKFYDPAGHCVFCPTCYYSFVFRSCYSVLPAQAVLSSLAEIKPITVSLKTEIMLIHTWLTIVVLYYFFVRTLSSGCLSGVL